MLLASYRKELFRPECNPNFQSLHCFAHLDQDVGAVLPYLNATLGGFEYTAEPPSVTFRVQGKLITVHPRLIAVNALKDEPRLTAFWMAPPETTILGGRPPSNPARGCPRPQLLEIHKLPADQLPALRPAHLHGLRRPGGGGWQERRGLPGAGASPGRGPARLPRALFPGISRGGSDRAEMESLEAAKATRHRTLPA